jgi:hypothetical protein
MIKIMQTSIEMIIEEVKRLSNIYENRVPSVLLFETLFKAKEMHKQEIIEAWIIKSLKQPKKD